LWTALANGTGSSYWPQITHCPWCGPLVGGNEFHSFGLASWSLMWTPAGRPGNVLNVQPAARIVCATDSVFDVSSRSRK
jgi:hypothetical protein